jgi:hypothetical protein
MTDARWRELEGKGGTLTEEEMKRGWHWCYDFDLMLVGPGMTAWEDCSCKGVS